MCFINKMHTSFIEYACDPKKLYTYYYIVQLVKKSMCVCVCIMISNESPFKRMVENILLVIFFYQCARWYTQVYYLYIINKFTLTFVWGNSVILYICIYYTYTSAYFIIYEYYSMRITYLRTCSVHVVHFG